MAQFPARAQAQAAVAAIAGRQHGVISTAQLHRCGVGPTRIRDWFRAARLHRIHRGVYAVGHAALSNEARWMAAVLACGAAAVLSHRSAAELWKLLQPRPGLVEVTVATASGRAQRRGIRIHRSSSLTGTATTARDGIRVTTPARTLADLRRTAPGDFRRALRQAEYLRLPIGTIAEADGTRSGLEARFLAFCRRRRLPVPEVNVKIGPYTVDFLWRPERVAVETDSFRTHGGAVAFEEDRARDLWLKARRFEVVRVTDRGLTTDPRGTAAALRSVLAAARRAAP